MAEDHCSGTLTQNKLELELSQERINYRKANKISEYRNVSVIEYRDIDGSLRTVVTESIPLKKHAEMSALEEVIVQRGVDPKNITRVYTELAPCDLPGRYYQRQLAKIVPNAEVTYSFLYGNPELNRQGRTEKLSMFTKLGLRFYRRPKR